MNGSGKNMMMRKIEISMKRKKPGEKGGNIMITYNEKSKIKGEKVKRGEKGEMFTELGQKSGRRKKYSNFRLCQDPQL